MNKLGALIVACVSLSFLLEWSPYIRADLHGHPDEAAHYTSGVMVHDYLFGALGSHPMSFAREFYWRHPKVAIGHWPPGYYAIEALWFGVFGTSIESARFFSLATLFACATAVWWCVRRACGAALAAAGAAVFLAMRVTRETGVLVMTDAAIAALSVAGLYLLTLAVRRERPVAAYAGFVLCTVSALWIKGSAWAILPAAVALPVLLGRIQVLKTAPFWLAVAVAFAAGVPFYAWAQAGGIGYPIPTVGLAAVSGKISVLVQLERRIEVLAPLRFAVPLWLIAAAVASSWVAFRRDGFGDTARMALAGIAGQIALQILTPATGEARFYLPTAAWAVIFLVASLKGTRLSGRWGLLLLAVLAAVGLQTRVPWDPETPAGEYRRATRTTGCADCVSLVAAGALGEGALISGTLAEGSRSAIVLRGNKVLAKSNWDGRNYQPRFSTAEDTGAWLITQAPDFVLIEKPRRDERQHVRLCREAVKSLAEYRPEPGFGKAFQLYRRITPLRGVRSAADLRSLQPAP